MASKIQVKRGNRADLPILSDGEFGLCQDTGEIFIGNGGSNIKIYPSTALTASNVTVADAGGMFESTNAEGALAELAMAILEILSGAAIVGKAEDSNKVGGFTVAKNVPSNAVFTDTVTTINGKTGAISKADIVALGIPSQDTNTTYSEISTSEINAGTSSTLRTITGRRVKYILDKVQGWINALTKSDIGLGDVENYSIATQSEAESGTANNRYMTPLRTKQAINTHMAEKVHQGEIHGFRLTEGKLEYFDGAEWQRVKGDGYPVGNVADFTAQVGNGEVTLKWQDPSDVTITDSNGTVITIARWAGTKLLRKTGTFPVNENDGTLVIDNTVKNQYQTNGLVDTRLVNGTTYYYMAFPYTDEDVVTIDSANRVSATPQADDDLTGSPGPKNLISGTMQEGFFGEVPASELITGDDLASQVGISQGTSQHSTAGWLKFAYKGKIQFIAKKPIRHSISWDAINTAKCVYGDSGDKTVTIGGLTYKVTLMKGANDKFNSKQPINGQTGGGSGYNGEVNHGSEWNRLMCQIHEQALNKSWDYPDNVEIDIGVMEHSLGNGEQGMYNDTDLVVKSGDGRYSWCQEMSTSTSYRLSRGHNGVSNSDRHTSSNSSAACGWRPRLELVP